MAWNRVELADEMQLPKLRKLKTPLIFKKTKKPFSKDNREEFTETQREIASGAPVAESIEDLEAKVFRFVSFFWCIAFKDAQLSDLHAGGKLKPGSYVEINTKMLNG